MGGEAFNFGESDNFDFGDAPEFDVAPKPRFTKPSEEPVTQIGPQEGPQTMFLTTPADIAIYGGSAGAGKTFSLLLEPLRHHDNKDFGAVCFRRNSKQVRNEGGLWHESLKMYTPLGGEPKQSDLKWVFPSGMRMGFGHLEYDISVHEWHGSQIPLIMFDELTNFTRYQFFYMLSRNRSDSGVPGYIRATCNPDADSWVRKFLDWWIGPDGYPIPERSGVIRWFVQIDDTLHWGNSKAELMAMFGEKLGKFAMSVTFIPAKLYDNKKLLEKDPAYEARLMALNKVERLRLLGGNWNIRETAGTMFRREWFQTVDSIPSGWTSVLRYWDRAATPVNPGNADPDWTRGVKLYRYPDNTFLVADVRSERASPGTIEDLIRQTAEHDGPGVKVMSQCDPGSAGKAEAMHFARLLTGYDVETETLTKNKIVRAKPVSAQVQAGNIKVVRASWNEDFYRELENFPDGAHDDIVDALSGAFNKLSHGLSILDVIAQQEAY